MLRTLLPLLLVLLAACEDDTGTPCQDDFACSSNTCSGGVCASPWAASLTEAFQDKDEPPSKQRESGCSQRAPGDCPRSLDARSSCTRWDLCTQR
jgi:hypothetical protein